MTEIILAENRILKKKCEEYKQTIEDIRAEIEELDTYYHAPDALKKVLAIIDSRIGEKEKK